MVGLPFKGDLSVFTQYCNKLVGGGAFFGGFFVVLRFGFFCF